MSATCHSWKRDWRNSGTTTSCSESPTVIPPRGDVFSRPSKVQRFIGTEGHPFDTVGAPVDHRIGVNLLTNCYRHALGDVQTVGVTVASGQNDIVGLVDHSLSTTGVEVSTWSSDVVGWAESIVHIVQHNS